MNKYEEKYKEALEKAKIWQEHLNETGDKDFADELIYIFPELKESEGEKVRKEILEVAKTVVLRDGTLYGKKYNCREWIAWLEKLKVFTEHGAGLYYFGNSSFTYIGSPIWNNDSWLEKQGEQEHTLDIEIPFGAKDSELQEATYLIPEGFHAEIECDKVVIKKGKQKPAIWREEDERMYSIVFEEYKNRQYYSHPTLEDYDISGQILGWLKSLKDRVIPQQKSAWSEEDETILTNIIIMLEVGVKNYFIKDNMSKVISWLKSIRNRIKGG